MMDDDDGDVDVDVDVDGWLAGWVDGWMEDDDDPIVLMVSCFDVF